ncbi:hypothetical protein D3C72_1620060 [compost metagenome]
MAGLGIDNSFVHDLPKVFQVPHAGHVERRHDQQVVKMDFAAKLHQVIQLLVQHLKRHVEIGTFQLAEREVFQVGHVTVSSDERRVSLFPLFMKQIFTLFGTCQHDRNFTLA